MDNRGTTLPISFFIGDATIDDTGSLIATDRASGATNPFDIPTDFEVLSMLIKADVDLKYSNASGGVFKTIAAGVEKRIDLIDGERKIWLKRSTSGNAAVVIEFSGNKLSDA
jgi:hypothetical protein